MLERLAEHYGKIAEVISDESLGSVELAHLCAEIEGANARAREARSLAGRLLTQLRVAQR